MKKIITIVIVSIVLMVLPFSAGTILKHIGNATNTVANLPNGPTDYFADHYPNANLFIYHHVVLLMGLTLLVGIWAWRWRFGLCVSVIAFILQCAKEVQIGFLILGALLLIIYVVRHVRNSRRREHCVIGQTIRI